MRRSLWKTHTHFANSQSIHQLPGQAPLFLLSHNCSRASVLSVLVHQSQAANHQQLLRLTLPLGSNHSAMEPIISTWHKTKCTDCIRKQRCCILELFIHLCIIEVLAVSKESSCVYLVYSGSNRNTAWRQKKTELNRGQLDIFAFSSFPAATAHDLVAQTHF